MNGLERVENLLGVPSYHYDPVFAGRVRDAMCTFRPSAVALECPEAFRSELEWALTCWPAPVCSRSGMLVVPFVPGGVNDAVARLWADRVKAPLLLLAGGHDPRCPKTEAQQVVDAIKKRSGVVEYKVYENEGHGFAKVENQIDAYKRVAEFLKAHVPPADCGCSLNE